MIVVEHMLPMQSSGGRSGLANEQLSCGSAQQRTFGSKITQRSLDRVDEERDETQAHRLSSCAYSNQSMQCGASMATLVAQHAKIMKVSRSTPFADASCSADQQAMEQTSMPPSTASFPGNEIVSPRLIVDKRSTKESFGQVWSGSQCLLDVQSPGETSILSPLSSSLQGGQLLSCPQDACPGTPTSPVVSTSRPATAIGLLSSSPMLRSASAHMGHRLEQSQVQNFARSTSAAELYTVPEKRVRGGRQISELSTKLSEGKLHGGLASGGCSVSRDLCWMNSHSQITPFGSPASTASLTTSVAAVQMGRSASWMPHAASSSSLTSDVATHIRQSHAGVHVDTTNHSASASSLLLPFISSLDDAQVHRGISGLIDNERVHGGQPVCSPSRSLLSLDDDQICSGGIHRPMEQGSRQSSLQLRGARSGVLGSGDFSNCLAMLDSQWVDMLPSVVTRPVVTSTAGDVARSCPPALPSVLETSVTSTMAMGPASGAISVGSLIPAAETAVRSSSTSCLSVAEDNVTLSPYKQKFQLVKKQVSLDMYGHNGSNSVMTQLPCHSALGKMYKVRRSMDVFHEEPNSDINVQRNRVQRGEMSKQQPLINMLTDNRAFSLDAYMGLGDAWCNVVSPSLIQSVAPMGGAPTPPGTAPSGSTTELQQLLARTRTASSLVRGSLQSQQSRGSPDARVSLLEYAEASCSFGADRPSMLSSSCAEHGSSSNALVVDAVVSDNASSQK